MSPQRFRMLAVFAWLAVSAVGVGIRFSFAAPMTSAEGFGWLMFAILPSVVMLLVFRGAPPPTIAEVLFKTEGVASRRRGPGSTS